jgi:hypothetical protein
MVLPEHFSRSESVAIGRRRRIRNIAVLLALIAVAVLFYAITIVKLAKA